MNPHVYLKVAGVSELFLTLITGIRLFSCVDPHVIFKLDHGAERLAAHIAEWLLSWFFPRVDPCVVLKRTGVAAAFAAGLADVWPLSCVSQHVVLQGALVTATFATDLACEKLFSGVFAQVIFQDSHVAASKAENVAAVFLLHVSDSVSCQR